MNYDDIPSLVDYETREEFIDLAASKAQDGMVFVELGVFLGGTVCRLASKIKDRGIDCEIYAIDNWQYGNISKESYNWVNSFSQVYTNTIGEITDGDSGFRAFKKTIDLLQLDINYINMDTVQAGNLFKDNSVDYIFFDANHGSGGIKEELAMWIPKAKDKALLGIHDYSNGTGGPTEEFVGYKLNTTSNRATGIIRDTL